MTHNKKKLKTGSCVYKCCLGVFECIHCNFVRPPTQPKSKKKNAIPPGTKDKCPRHMEDELVHKKCTCTINILDIGDNWKITHQGEHNHSRPPWTGKLDKNSQTELDAFVLNNSEVPPCQLKMGNTWHKAAAEIHSSLSNLDKLKHERKFFLQKFNVQRKSTLANFMTFGSDLPENFMRSHSLVGNNPHLIFMDKEMEKLVMDSNICFQTDSVEGFIEENGIKNINITFTSGYDSDLDRWVPLCISILFGKKEADYKLHWNRHQKFNNDGRPPDISDLLLKKTKKRKGNKQLKKGNETNN